MGAPRVQHEAAGASHSSCEAARSCQEDTRNVLFTIPVLPGQSWPDILDRFSLCHTILEWVFLCVCTHKR